MAPLSLEIYDSQTKRWDERFHVEAGSVLHGISGLDSNGDKVTYLYGCPQDDSQFELYRCRNLSQIQMLGNVNEGECNLSDLELVKVLRKGDEPYSFQLEIGGTKYQMRLTHK